jgi:hypothetical protein
MLYGIEVGYLDLERIDRAITFVEDTSAKM